MNHIHYVQLHYLLFQECISNRLLVQHLIDGIPMDNIDISLDLNHHLLDTNLLYILGNLVQLYQHRNFDKLMMH